MIHFHTYCDILQDFGEAMVEQLVWLDAVLVIVIRDPGRIPNRHNDSNQTNFFKSFPLTGGLVTTESPTELLA